MTAHARLAELPIQGPHTLAVFLSFVPDGDSGTQEAWGILSEDERARANRFVRATDREHYVAAHTLMRRALARQIGASPGTLEFGASSHGKPSLVRPVLRPAPGFSLSHTAGLTAVALIADGRRVGVDVERCGPPARTGGIERVLGARERAWVDAQPPDHRDAAMLRVWTRKEAVLKADGRGLSALDTYDVVDETCGDFQVVDLELPAGHAGALAYETSAGPSCVVIHYV